MRQNPDEHSRGGVLEVRGLTKAYGGLTVPSEVSFAVRAGEAAAALGVPVGVLVCAVLVEAQASRRRTSLPRHGITVLVAALAVFAGVLALPWPTWTPEPRVTGVVLVVAAAAAVWHALRALALMTRGAPSDGAEIAAVAATATTFLDPSLLSGTTLLRQARATGAVRPVRFSGGRRRALLRAELARHIRHPPAFLVFCALVPYLAARTPSPPSTSCARSWTPRWARCRSGSCAVRGC